MSDNKKSPQLLKRLLQIVAGAVVLSGIGVALLPTIASSDWGHAQIIRLANSMIPGTLDIKQTQLSWFGSQTLSGIVLKDANSRTILSIDKFTTDASLVDFLSSHFAHQSLQLTGLNLKLVEEEPGMTNLQRAIGQDPIPMNSVKTAAYTPFAIDLTNVNGTVDLESKIDPIKIHLTGNTQQGELSGLFDIDVELNGANLDKGLVTQEEKDFALKVKVTNFPVALIDHFVAMDKPELAGIAQAAFGATLDINVTKTVAPTGATYNLQAKSPKLSASLTGNVINDKFILSKPGDVNFIATPDLVKFLSKAKVTPEDLLLLNQAQAHLVIQELVVPLNSKGKDLDVSTTALLTLPQADFVIGKLHIPVSLKNIVSKVRASESSKDVVLEVDGESLVQGKAMPMHLQATLDKPIRWNNLIEQIKDRLEVEAQVDNAPLGFIDQQLDLKGELLKYVGSEASIELHGVLTQKYIDLKIAVDGELLSLSNTRLYRDEHKWELTAHLDAEPKSPVAAILGETTKFQVQTVGGQLEAMVTCPAGSARIAGHLSEQMQFMMTESAMLQFYLTPQAAALALGKSDIVQLTKPTSILFKILPLQKAIDFRFFDIAQLASTIISGQLQIEEINLASLDPSSPSDAVVVRNLFAPWEIDFIENRFKLSLKGDTQLTGNNNGSIQGNVIIKNWWRHNKLSVDTAIVNATMGIKNVPVLLLEAMSGQDELIDLVGKTLDVDVNVHAQIDNPSKNALEATVKGENLSGKVALNIGDVITLKNPQQPISLDFTVTPERFKALRKILAQGSPSAQDTLILSEPAQLSAKIHMLSISGLKENTAPLAHSGIKADITINSLKIADPVRKQNLVLENIVANIDSQNLTKKILFNIKAEEKAQNGNGGEWNFAGNMENALSNAGTFDLQGMSLNLEAKSNRLPVGLLCQMACSDNVLRDKIEALLGRTIDTNVVVKLQRMNGPVQANLKGSNGYVKMDARLSDGMITLNKPLEAEVAVTKQLGQSILQDIIPILSGIITSDNPIKVTIDPQGFSMPIKDTAVTNIQIGKAVIDLGRIQFSNSGELGTILALLKPSDQHLLSVWFTPLYIQMQNGALQVKRMDMLLLDRYPIAIWGNVNFPNDKVDLTIGLTGAALNQALSMNDLDKKYMMQLPFKGRIGSASIDKAQATTRITALVAQSKGTPQGVIIGTFLDIAGGTFTEAQPPAPTTNPLPWGDIAQVADTEKTSTKKKHNDPVKQIEKGATQFIKNLFK